MDDLHLSQLSVVWNAAQIIPICLVDLHHISGTWKVAVALYYPPPFLLVVRSGIVVLIQSCLGANALLIV